jgi:exonuclease V
MQYINAGLMWPQELRETEAMAAGNAIHAALEAQTSMALEVDVATPEDAWAVRFLNLVTAIRQLASDGMTREFYIFGCIQVLCPSCVAL